MGSPAGRRVATPLLLVVVLLLAIVGSPGTGADAARCGPEPTSLFVQKGEKRTVSFWHHAEPEGSGAEPEPAELPAPTAAADPAAPVIVTAGPPDSDSDTPLYVQPPHIVLPEAPPLPVDGGLSADWKPDAEQLKQGAAADGSDLSTAGGQDGSGSALNDGDSAFSDPSNDPDSLDQIFESFSLAFQSSGNRDIAAADEDDNTILLDADDIVTLPSGGSDAVSSEGSGGDSAPLPAADAVEGSGAAQETTSENLSVGEELITVSIPESPPAAAAQPSPSEEAAPVPELPSPAANGAAEWDGLEPDELLPLTEIAGDLAVSASEPVAVVAPAPAGLSEEERERLLVVKELQDDRVVLEHVPDPEEGSGDGLAISADDPVADGSGMSKDEEAPEDRKDVESEIIKAVVDVMNIMTDIHGLVGKEEDEKQADDPAERIAAFRPSAYRFVDSYAKPNQAAAPVRPLWSGFHRPGAPPRLPPPPRPLPRPDPVWKHPQHRPGPSRVYFPGQFHRGGPPDGRLPTYRPDERRATYRPPGGGRFAPRVGAPARPLPGYVRRGPSPSGYGQPFKFDAGESLRRKDDHLFRFLRSQPYPFVSSLTGSGPEPRGARQPRAAPLDCEWQIETEPHLYLLLTLHNLSAPLTVDCSGAYIEVERENDGFEARWCGDRVRQEGTRPHMVFARGEIRIAVHSNSRGTGLPTGFDAEVEVIDLLDGGQYVKFRRSGLNFRRLIQEPLLPAT
ncbi:hypothetical protein FJT64_016122 [Amphibalanus amphitrite]|uniref:CUB domain-containing protein n=1 Tax=Amphibalanus amphitrite TaxID=1232801 RepID=A0A6A4XBG3_AMPAM|nr:hypothetical protein FJT64_016122 [Amphibalanus amphitrite]